MHKLTIGWMYPNLLNLHGERGSLQALVSVGQKIGIQVDVLLLFTTSFPHFSLQRLANIWKMADMCWL